MWIKHTKKEKKVYSTLFSTHMNILVNLLSWDLCFIFVIQQKRKRKKEKS